MFDKTKYIDSATVSMDRVRTGLRPGMDLVSSRIDHDLHKLYNFVAGEIAGVRDIRFDVGCKWNPFGSSAIAHPGDDDISERCRDGGGRAVPDLERYEELADKFTAKIAVTAVEKNGP